jgi:phosphatidylinositol alpha-1,6-mannosyltransferase
VGRGINSDKVFVINNGVDHDLADAPIQPDFLNHFEQKYQLDLKGKKILISMGRPVKRKGFSWFVQSVMPQLPKDVVLLLIGPRTKKKYRFLSLLPTFLSNQIEIIFSLFSDEAALKEGIQLLKNKDRVIELGKLPFAEVIQLLQLADVFVMPNIKVHGDMEGFGLVALESAICGTPVLASGIEGIQDAVQAGKNGWLLPPAAAEQWKEALQQILYSKAETKQFGLAARNYTLSHFSWGKMAATYHQIFSQFALK